jgi:hypothetical protein
MGESHSQAPPVVVASNACVCVRDSYQPEVPTCDRVAKQQHSEQATFLTFRFSICTSLGAWPLALQAPSLAFPTHSHPLRASCRESVLLHWLERK